MVESRSKTNEVDNFIDCSLADSTTLKKLTLLGESRSFDLLWHLDPNLDLLWHRFYAFEAFLTLEDQWRESSMAQAFPTVKVIAEETAVVKCLLHRKKIGGHRTLPPLLFYTDVLIHYW